MDQITSIRIFMAVAETGALNSAAQQMEISPSAVSKHIAALENKLGAHLLNRTTRQVALKEFDAAYLQSWRPYWLCAPTCGTTFANFSFKNIHNYQSHCKVPKVTQI